MAKRFFQRRWLRVLLVLAIIFVLIQFYRPALENPPVTGDLQAQAEFKSIFQRACYDCHSNETKLLWFDQPAPAYWLVAADVKEGRRWLNFSHWDSLPAEVQKGKLFESLNQIVFKEMPLRQYAFLHRDARISAGDISVMRRYLASLATPKLADSASVGRADSQYLRWISDGGNGSASAGNGGGANIAGSAMAGNGRAANVAGAARPGNAGSARATGPVAPAPNGLAFFADYADWQPISTTERWDNGTMRVITGNPVAVKAIREGHTNPWPDGTVFAKIAWKGLFKPSGVVTPGEFLQVEFMVKDGEKYKSTEGWGFGRWKGDQLKPYGKDASFATECVHCHQPMKAFDLVFSQPVDWAAGAMAESRAGGDNRVGAINAEGGDNKAGADKNGTRDGTADRVDTSVYSVLRWKAISSGIDKTTGTMSTLYGNDEAVKAARKGLAYGDGAQLALVTWVQREDEHWYGANIPETIQRVERWTAGGTGAGDYTQYKGKPLMRVGNDSVNVQERIAYLTSLRASVMP